MNAEDLYINLEMVRSVRNLLKSDVTNKEIMETCNLSNKTVSDLRNLKKDVDSVSFKTMSTLYMLAKSKNLDSVTKELNDLKGKYKSLPLKVYVKKVYVCFEEQDMFLNGIMAIDIPLEQGVRLNSDKEQLKSIDMPTSVFLLEHGSFVDSYQLGYQFNCRYGGTGPSNFVREIQKISAIPEEQLQKIIFHNSSVVYDAVKDEIKGFPSKAKGRGFELYSYKGKLIIKLDYLDNSNGFYSFDDITRQVSSEKKISVKNIKQEIDYFRDILKEKYNYCDSIRKIKYVNDTTKKETEIYGRDWFYDTNNDYNLIFDFKDYELWIPYQIRIPKNFKEDIFELEELSSLLKMFEINYENSQLLKKIKKVQPLSEINILDQ